MEQKSTHSGHEHGFIDTTEVATHIRVNARQTEDEILLKKLLGVDVQVMDEKGIAGQVASRLFEGMAVTRDGLDRAGFESKLETKLEKAFKRLRVEHAHPAGENEHLQKVKLVTEAIRDLAPPELLRKFAKSQVQAFVPESKDVGPNRFRIYCDILDVKGASVNRPVEIDFQHPFWQEEYANEVGLQNALKNKSAREVGVSFPVENGVTPHPENAKLKPQDVQNILSGAMNVLDSSKTLDPLDRKGIATGGTPPNVDVYVDIRRLMQQRDGANELIAALDTRAKLEAALVKDAHVRNCIRFNPPLDESKLASYPTLWTDLSKEIFDWVRGPGVTNGPLAMKGHGVFELYERSRKQAETYKKIATGTVNEESTAIVLTLLQQHEDLMEATKKGDTKKLDKEITELTEQKRLHEDIAGLRAMKQRALSDSYKNLIDEKNNIKADSKLLKSASPTWKSKVALNYLSSPTESISGDTDAQKELRAKLSEALKTVEEEIGYCEEVRIAANKINSRIKKCVTDGILKTGFSSTELAKIIDTTSGDLKPAFKAADDFSVIADNLITELIGANLKKESDIKTELEEKEKKRKEVGHDLTGADAQFAILKKYFMEYKNMSEEDAKKAANYLLARSMMNVDMSNFAEHLVTETYGVHDSETRRANKYSQKVIMQVARGAGIGIDPRPSFWSDDSSGPWEQYSDEAQPHWSKASYEQLLTAYYAMRTLEKDKSHALNVEATTYFRAQMAQILKVLTDKHAELFWQEFGPVAATKGKDVEDKAKEPMTQEKLKKVMRQFAESEMPKGYEEKVKKAIDYADRRVDRKWRATKRALAATGGATLGLLWKNKTYSAKNALTKGKNTVRDVVATLNRNKGNIALFALGTVVAGPFVAAAALAMKKAVDGPSAPAGSGGEHHPS